MQDEPSEDRLEPRLKVSGPHCLRPRLKKHFCPLSLDPNSAHRNLRLSRSGKKATRVSDEQLYPRHPDRFDFYEQVLCDSGLTGRSYWEVQWSGTVYISVCYAAIRRKGDSFESEFGLNAQSWSLSCSEDGFYVLHKNRQTPLHHPPACSGTVAVDVDCAAGALSFYTVCSERLIHLHTFSTSFTQTLVPGFGLWTEGSSVALTD